jgi:hypothetical protein
MEIVGALIMLIVGTLVTGLIYMGTQVLVTNAEVMTAIAKQSSWVAANFSMLSLIPVVIIGVYAVSFPFSMMRKDFNDGGNRLGNTGVIGGYAIGRAIMTIAGFVLMLLLLMFIAGLIKIGAA